MIQTYELPINRTLVHFYYGKGAPNGNYSERELKEWERRFATWRAWKVFAYLNYD